MPKVSLSRIYSFSAAHRLHAPELSADENRDVYDKCNNYYGHGHDYYVEVTVQGPLNPKTGMIIGLPELDSMVVEFLKSLDHKHLNLEVDYFKTRISTGENIVQFLWNELDARIPDGLLYHIRLRETNNNFFEIGKEHS